MQERSYGCMVDVECQRRALHAKCTQVTMKCPLLILPMALIRNSDAEYPF